MDCDAEKLIAAVESRPVIFNFTLKEYKSRNAVEKAWEEVASEMNVSVADCKTKWASIRNSYNRALRESECQISGTKRGKRKKWYLMDTLEFLRDFTGTHRKSVSYLPCVSTIEEMYPPKDESQEVGEQEEGLSSSATSSPTPPPPKSKISTAKKVAEETTEFLKSRTNSSEKESPTISFFKGIVEEVDSLPRAKRAAFKVDVMNLLSKYMNEEANQ